MTNGPGDTTQSGIDQQLDAGIAADDHEADLDPEDARARGTLRTDPDAPVEGLQAASDASTSANPADPD
jgi:hypothetical protein